MFTRTGFPPACERWGEAHEMVLRNLITQEPVRDDSSFSPLQADGSALPGSQEGDSPFFQRNERILGSRGGGTLADDHKSWIGPLKQPVGIGGPAAVVGGEERVEGPGRLCQQRVKAFLLEVAGQQGVTTE